MSEEEVSLSYGVSCGIMVIGCERLRITGLIYPLELGQAPPL